MERETERALAARAVELGRSADGAALPELIRLLAAPSAEARRLAASAIGKLAGITDAPAAVAALTRLLRDPHPQARQYAVKALKAGATRAQVAEMVAVCIHMGGGPSVAYGRAALVAYDRAAKTA